VEERVLENEGEYESFMTCRPVRYVSGLKARRNELIALYRKLEADIWWATPNEQSGKAEVRNGWKQMKNTDDRECFGAGREVCDIKPKNLPK